MKLRVLAVTAGLMLLTAACGSSPSSNSSPSSTGTGSGGAPSAYVTRVLAFARCMRAHGVPNFPDPDSRGEFDKHALLQLGISDSRLRALQRPCLHLLPGGPPPLSAADQQAYLRAAACMRSHGIPNFPDPVFSGGDVHFPIPAGIDVNSKTVIQARRICQRLIPAGLPYSGSEG